MEINHLITPINQVTLKDFLEENLTYKEINNDLLEKIDQINVKFKKYNTLEIENKKMKENCDKMNETIANLKTKIEKQNFTLNALQPFPVNRLENILNQIQIKNKYFKSNTVYNHCNLN